MRSFKKYRMEENLGDDKFSNLDAWARKSIVPKYEKEIVQKLLRKKKEEEKKQEGDWRPVASGGGVGIPRPSQPLQRPYIIGDPSY
jgi:hypothetical protein